tara:strand:- start:2225 stop:2971 length:747 start_codon:yes stop_codon:yes gene_type:complete
MTIQLYRILVALVLLQPWGAHAFNAARWLQEFYQNDNLGSFETALEHWKSRENLEDIDRRQPIVGFLSFVFEKYPETIEIALKNPDSLSQAELEAFGNALHRANTESAKEALKTIRQDHLLTQPKPAPLLEIEITQAFEMDLCWGYFYGSGDVNVVTPIVNVLGYSQFEAARDAYLDAREKEDDELIQKYREDAFRYAMYEAARWSLAFNAKRHPKVRDHLEQLAQTSPFANDLKAILSELDNVSDAL